MIPTLVLAYPLCLLTPLSYVALLGRAPGNRSQNKFFPELFLSCIKLQVTRKVTKLPRIPLKLQSPRQVR